MVFGGEGGTDYYSALDVVSLGPSAAIHGARETLIATSVVCGLHQPTLTSPPQP